MLRADQFANWREHIQTYKRGELDERRAYKYLPESRGCTAISNRFSIQTATRAFQWRVWKGETLSFKPPAIRESFGYAVCTRDSHVVIYSRRERLQKRTRRKKLLNESTNHRGDSGFFSELSSCLPRLFQRRNSKHLSYFSAQVRKYCFSFIRRSNCTSR